MTRTFATVGAALFTLVAGAVSVAGQPQPTTPPGSPRCFYDIDFENWKAPDSQTMYIRVRGDRYFQVGLANKCYDLTVPDARLITHFHGSDLVCSPVDWDLKVAAPFGNAIPEPCIVSSMRQLSPAEVATIPRRFKP
jgi:hypothetical protein